MCLCMPTGEVRGINLHVVAVKHCLKRGQQRGSEYGFTTNIKKVQQHPLMAMIAMKANPQWSPSVQWFLIYDPALSEAGH